jgi:hypothetical protein
MSDVLLFKLKDLADTENLKKVYVVVSKTKSMFNRSLDELPKIKAVVDHYVHEHPFLGEYPIRILPSFANAFYNFEKGEFALGLFNSSILAHEIEHCLSLRDSEIYRKLLTTSKVISGLSGGFMLPVALGSYIKHQNPTTTEDVNTVFNLLSLAHGVSVAPSLYEEGRANAAAILHNPEKIETMKTLLPAYGTYLLNAAVPIGFYQFAKQMNPK